MSEYVKNTTWAGFKSFIQASNVPALYVDDDTQAYELYAFNGPFGVKTLVAKTTPANADQTDWETNFKPSANPTLSDKDGNQFARHKITKSGNGLQCHSLDFTTAKLASVYNKKYNLTDYGHTTIKFYDSSDTELTTQATIDSSCVLTKLDIEPAFDYEIIGGEMRQTVSPATPVRLWFVHLLSSHEFCSGGNNLQFLDAREPFVMDGRAPKFMPHDNPIDHTGRLTLYCRHDAGYQHYLQLRLEIFKS